MESFGQGQDVDLRNSAERRPGPRVPTSSEKAHLFWQPWPYTVRAKREAAVPVRLSRWVGGGVVGLDTSEHRGALKHGTLPQLTPTQPHLHLAPCLCHFTAFTEKIC